VQKVILVGFDGANPEFVERYLPHLPTFRQLIAAGSWGPMLPTVPCDTPTNWTALATGATAAASGITGFAFHHPGHSLTEKLGINEYAEMRQAEFLWEAADRQGRESILINYPFSWHSRDLEHTIIVGGDAISGGASCILRPACHCTADRLDQVRGGHPLELQQEGLAYIADLRLYDREKLEWSATGLVSEGMAGTAIPAPSARLIALPGEQPQLEIRDTSGGRLAKLQEGEWSQPLALPIAGETGWLRFFLVRLSQDGRSLQLYHTMITRPDAWTKPGHWAPTLLQEVGPYQQGMETGGQMETRGWFGDYALPADLALLDHTGNTLLGYAQRLAAANPQWQYLYLQLHSSDGLNHRRLGHMDPQHPRATPERTRLAERWMRENYQATDRLLAQAAQLAEEHDAVLVVVSDHSAVPTHTWVDTARPFIERGWLSFDSDGKWDPTRSKVRKMINHSIYVNLRGRQPNGVVPPEEYEHVRDEIISRLYALRDPRTGDCPVAVAARREDLASIGTDGPFFGDVVYLMRPGYTNQPASEERLLDAETLSAFLDQPQQALASGWGFHRSIQGNHHDYMPNAAYPGLCSNRSILLVHGPGIRQGHRISGARTIDVAPTIAALTGIAPPEQCEGRALIDVMA